MISSYHALERLREGNQRFVSGETRGASASGPPFSAEGMATQAPFAVLLGCSDSRVPTEVIFDQGFGDLFVVRVAGNIAAPSQIESIEFAVEQFGSRLVVVLGHSACGAVSATVDELLRVADADPRAPHSILDHIQPAVAPLLAELSDDRSAFIARGVRANVASTVEALRRRWNASGEPDEGDRLSIVGAEYSLESGRVDFFDVGRDSG